MSDLDDTKVVISIDVEGRKMEWTEKGAMECFARLCNLGIIRPARSREEKAKLWSTDHNG